MYVLFKCLYFCIAIEIDHRNKHGMATNSFPTLRSHWDGENNNHNIIFSVLITRGKNRGKTENKQASRLEYKAIRYWINLLKTKFSLFCIPFLRL